MDRKADSEVCDIMLQREEMAPILKVNKEYNGLNKLYDINTLTLTMGTICTRVEAMANDSRNKSPRTLYEYACAISYEFITLHDGSATGGYTLHDNRKKEESLTTLSALQPTAKRI